MFKYIILIRALHSYILRYMYESFYVVYALFQFQVRWVGWAPILFTRNFRVTLPPESLHFLPRK